MAHFRQTVVKLCVMKVKMMMELLNTGNEINREDIIDGIEQLFHEEKSVLEVKEKELLTWVKTLSSQQQQQQQQRTDQIVQWIVEGCVECYQQRFREEPLPRQLVLRLALQVMGARKLNRTHLCMEIVTLGVSDVWSATRKMTVKLMGDAVKMNQVDEGVLGNLLEILKMDDQENRNLWKAQEGALLGLGCLLEKFPITDQNVTKEVVHLGFEFLKHEQLTIRLYVVRDFAMLLKYHNAFMEKRVLLDRTMQVMHGESALDAFHADGILQLTKTIFDQYKRANETVETTVFKAYLSLLGHEASTVRQTCSEVICTIALCDMETEAQRKTQIMTELMVQCGGGEDWRFAEGSMFVIESLLVNQQGSPSSLFIPCLEKLFGSILTRGFHQEKFELKRMVQQIVPHAVRMACQVKPSILETLWNGNDLYLISSSLRVFFLLVLTGENDNKNEFNLKLVRTAIQTAERMMSLYLDTGLPCQDASTPVLCTVAENVVLARQYMTREQGKNEMTIFSLSEEDHGKIMIQFFSSLGPRGSSNKNQQQQEDGESVLKKIVKNNGPVRKQLGSKTGYNDLVRSLVSRKNDAAHLTRFFQSFSSPQVAREFVPVLLYWIQGFSHEPNDCLTLISCLSCVLKADNNMSCAKKYLQETCECIVELLRNESVPWSVAKELLAITILLNPGHSMKAKIVDAGLSRLQTIEPETLRSSGFEENEEENDDWDSWDEDEDEDDNVELKLSFETILQSLQQTTMIE